ncbi:ABC transporter ATP-binding protein [Legionella cardiaca]|uniref:ABC transporter ATP-binding protein n=1 Tax=Legionella cardiaca TaxID=1071983 RepID=A0ABY8AQ45_9GAMM|nr:ABC transporter ATP-binding protein [Legionella cardiaca]WED42828.1 ABC transporter ATP-binding protein [Legionella cardiaca]
MDIVIKAENLGKAFKIYANSTDRLKHYLKKTTKNSAKEFWALHNLSFDIKKGETVGVLGCNGSGKSTLLQLIAAILKPSTGTIDVKGRVSALLELGSGFNLEFTGRENIYFNATLLGLSKKEIDNKYNEIVKFAEIGEFIEQPVKTYSSGMLVRLAFSVMIHVSPDILIIDEALAVGDIFFQQKCIRFLKENFADKTKIFVAHELSTISSLCSRVLCLHNGSLTFDGDVAEGIEHYLHTSFSKNRQASPTSAHPSEINWTKLTDDKLSGKLEVKINGIQILINNHPAPSAKATIRHQDRVIIKLLVYSTKSEVNAIFGYLLCDKYGNFVFGQNSCNNQTVHLLKNPGYYVIDYHFIWPDIHQGVYTLIAGIGEGEHALSHDIQCWAQGAFVFECISPHAVHGIFNNPIVSFNVESLETALLEE